MMVIFLVLTAKLGFRAAPREPSPSHWSVGQLAGFREERVDTAVDVVLLVEHEDGNKKGNTVRVVAATDSAVFWRRSSFATSASAKPFSLATLIPRTLNALGNVPTDHAVEFSRRLDAQRQRAMWLNTV